MPARRSGAAGLGNEPSRDCDLCPRLAAFRAVVRTREPSWHNAPVRSFGDGQAKLLIVGLAPGLKGANRTGRPFTGDYAGELLYETLLAFGLAQGTYRARPDDGLQLSGVVITNAVRCVPPLNKPEPAEIATCRAFLTDTIRSLPRLKAILALGRIAHDSVVRALASSPAKLPFKHGAVHQSPSHLKVFDSYHCSRYNTNTGVLTAAMFAEIFARISQELSFPHAAIAPANSRNREAQEN
jgi:uracil-DNA glycosylase